MSPSDQEDGKKCQATSAGSENFLTSPCICIDKSLHDCRLSNSVGFMLML